MTDRFGLCAFMVVAFLTLAYLQRPKEQIQAAAPARHRTPDSANRYYAIFYGQQSLPDNKIKLAHTFASFVRVSDGRGSPRVTEQCTISWLPVSGVISFAHPAERGFNMSLDDTLRSARDRGLEVTAFGPYPIREELFRRAVDHERTLSRGDYLYKANDYQRGVAKNCIHAVADIYCDDGALQTGTARGPDATRLVVQHLSPFFLSDATPEAAESSLLADAFRLDRVNLNTTADLAEAR